MIDIGTQPPNFKLPDLEGKSHQLEDSLGKVTVINFWSADCEWSQRADETIQPLLKKWAEDVVTLSVASNANETVKQLASAAAQRGVVTLLLDAKREVAEMFAAQTTPHIFILDKGGVLQYQGGLDDVTWRQPDSKRNYLVEAVEALLAGELPEVKETPPYGCTLVYYDAD